MTKQFINPPQLGGADSPFSQGVRAGNTLYISGQSGVDADGCIIAADDAVEQCRAIFRRVASILAAGGAAPADVVMVRGFLKRRSDIEATWQVRKEFFGDHRPASTTFLVDDVEAGGALMSFEVVAILDAIPG
jgi:2-iminobutanoate/2-iminopropanoate deaminase